MHKMSRYYLLFILCVLSGLLSTCQIKLTSLEKRALEIEDGGFLSGEPCGPPCFMGITPDMTAKAQAMETFQQQFDISNCEEWPGLKNGQDIWCNPVNIKFSTSDKVSNINFSLTQPLTIEEAIAKYGPPSGLEIIGFGPGANERTTSVVMELFFDSIHTMVSLPEQMDDTYDVEPLAQIEWISYLGNTEWQIKKEDTQSWHGYGNYQGPYWAGP